MGATLKAVNRETRQADPVPSRVGPEFADRSSGRSGAEPRAYYVQWMSCGYDAMLPKAENNSIGRSRRNGSTRTGECQRSYPCHGAGLLVL